MSSSPTSKPTAARKPTRWSPVCQRCLEKNPNTRGVTLEEMDLDAVLARKPQLALVDELAHTNTLGSRHAKRYQDIIELLDAGIGVFSTMNVQHAESRVDTVRQITGSAVQETVPDSLLDGAEVELIDLPPQDLLKRLDEGKVYMPERAELAMMNFFREGNLNALREMALRLAADHVGQDVHHYLQAMQITGPWKSGHRLLVGVSPSPYSQNMIRWTRRLADNLDCPWLAVYVELPRPLAADEQERLTKNLALARELGAEIFTTPDADVARAILRVARQQNVTQIVVGKPAGAGLIEWWRGGSLLRKLVRDSGHIELHIVRPELSDGKTMRFRRWQFEMHSPPWQYFTGLGVVLFCTLLNAGLDRAKLCDPQALALIYLLGIVPFAAFAGRGPTLAAATASALLWDYFFLPPRFTLYLTHPEDVMMFCMYFVVALVCGHLVTRLRFQERAERRREQRATARYLLTRDLADARDADDLSRARLVPGSGGQGLQFPFQVSCCRIQPARSKSALGPGPHSPLRKRSRASPLGLSATGRSLGPLHRQSSVLRRHPRPAAGTRAACGAVGVRAVEWPGELQPTVEQRDLLDAFSRQGRLGA